ncbi:MAG: cyclic nucleotide-binding domain-containing protein [Bdellovibrionaceae bacterium]|jgi:CRP-like cAMP-binding protein|nr:cyclic nucleotide-binding domain-containing protein [Pseudobdellovibrionaceae bacterium]
MNITRGVFISFSHLLKNVYLFKNMTESQLDSIGDISISKSYEAGDDVFLQSDSASAIYIISHGSIRIHQKNTTDENIEIVILGVGSHFGEMAFLDKEVRSASATAMEPTDLVEISYEALLEVLKKDLAISTTFYKEISHFLVNRLRVTTLDLSYARERNLSHF